MTTLAKHIIVARAENRPPMLEKSMCDSWASRIRLFIKGEKHGRMMLDSPPLISISTAYPGTNIILHGLPPDVYALVNYQEAAKDIWDRVKLLMKGTKLSYQERECRLYNLFDKFAYVQGETFKFVTDVKLAKRLYTTNYDQLYAYLSQHERHANEVRSLIYPPPQQFTQVYAAPIHHQHHHTTVNPRQHLVSPPPFISPLVTQQSQAKFPQLDSSLAVPMFQQGEDPIKCINKAMAFLSAVASRFPPSNNQLRTSSNPRNQATIQDGRVTVQQVQGRQNQSYAGTENRGIATNSKGNVAVGQPRVVKCYNCQGEGNMARQCTQPKRPRNAAWFKEKLMLAKAQEAGQILDEEQLVFLADLAVLMGNLSSCDPEVLFEVPYSDSYPNDMINLDVQEMQYSEQTHVDDFQDNEIHSGSNIIPYSQYLQESQDAVIQDTNPFAPNDLLVLSLVEQMTDHVAHLDKENQTNKMVNESLTAELERYKERITIFEQRLNVDLNKREKLIDSQMDDLIRDRNAKLADFQQENDTLKETLSNNVKEKESLSKTLTVFKTDSKEKESKYIDKEIVLEKQNKEVENIICKMYRSTQAMHMLTKPQVFYDDTHKQALGYQNLFHLRKAQQIQPTLYDGSVIAKEHVVISVIDDEETLILEEESRSKMLDKQNDPISIEKKNKISPIDYSTLNKIK
ncbi:copia protein [Tanacetum coccineum]